MEVAVENKEEPMKKVVGGFGGEELEEEEIGKVEKEAPKPKNLEKEAKKKKFKPPKTQVKQEEEQVPENETPEERKLRLRALQEKAELDLLGGTFATDDGEENKSESSSSGKGSDILSLFRGESLDEFKILSNYITKKLSPFQVPPNKKSLFNFLYSQILKKKTERREFHNLCWRFVERTHN